MGLKGYMALALSVLFVTGSAAPVQAQSRQPKVNNTTKKPPHPTTEYDTTDLKSMPQLRMMPEYTGKGVKFVSGMTYPNFKTGTCYTIRLQMKEPVSQVQQWYVGAFEMTGWKVSPSQTTSQLVVAQHTKEPIACSIMLNPTAAPGFKTQVTIKYQESTTRPQEPEG